MVSLTLRKHLATFDPTASGVTNWPYIDEPQEQVFLSWWGRQIRVQPDQASSHWNACSSTLCVLFPASPHHDVDYIASGMRVPAGREGKLTPYARDTSTVSRWRY